MTAAIKTISGITGLLTIGGPTAYVGWVAWDGNNPTGEKWLLDSGYSFNKPTTTSHENLSYDCSNNLFASKPDIDASKVYGCALMKMEKTQDDKFIKFNSEVALRKGDDGWIINTLFENHSVVKKGEGGYKHKLKFGYVFTKKKLKDNTTERWFFWDGNSTTLTKLYLKIPKVNESPWYDSSGFSRDDAEADEEHPQIAFSPPKEYYGIWISKKDGNTEWIFKNIEFWANKKEYSEVFCGDTKSCQRSANGNGYAFKIDDENTSTWLESLNATMKKDGATSHPTSTDIHQQINSVIDAIKETRGDWVDMDEVCDLRWTRNLDNSQKQQLSMYCTNGKKAK